MNVVIKFGVILAVVVVLVSTLVYATGLHTNMLVGGLLVLVLYIAFNVVAVFLGLSQTAAENGYGKQLLNSLGIGLVAGVLIFLGSWLLAAVVFPDALAEAREATLAMMENMGQPQEVIDGAAQGFDKATPLRQSLQGLIGTFITSGIAGAIIAIFKRKK